jgi:hypothetical protein
MRRIVAVIGNNDGAPDVLAIAETRATETGQQIY